MCKSSWQRRGFTRNLHSNIFNAELQPWRLRSTKHNTHTACRLELELTQFSLGRGTFRAHLQQESPVSSVLALCLGQMIPVTGKRGLLCFVFTLKDSGRGRSWDSLSTRCTSRQKKDAGWRSLWTFTFWSICTPEGERCWAGGTSLKTEFSRQARSQCH